MRAMLIVAAAVIVTAAAWADDKSDRERRVRVALALAAPDPAACGRCREDVDQARADAVRERRPLVLFVGGPCGGSACAAEKVGAIPAKAPRYSGDGRPDGERRVVVLEPKADGSGLWIAATLPATAEPERVAEAVVKATPKAVPPAGPPIRLNWDF